jgi:curved DNA-binding protein CbpA
MNPYQELGLDPNCSQEDIKQQYRTLAHQHHPDRGGDAERFKRISLAYEVLSDPERRARYDGTGQIDQDQGIRGEALERLGNMINHYVPNSNNELEDLIAKMRADINQAANQVEIELANNQRQIDNARIAHRKLRLKNTGENILKILVENLITRHESTAVVLLRRRLVLKLMSEMLDDYHYGDNEWLAALAPPN